MNDKVRAFIAVEMPEEVIKEIARVQESISGWKFTGKLTELENLHVTLKFLGEIDLATVEKVKERLSRVEFLPLSLKLGRIGSLNIRGNPKLVWVKVEGQSIWNLQKQVDEALKDLFKPEEQFMSHLTIARLKYVADKQGFRKHLGSCNVRETKFIIPSFSLKQSELRPLGPIYTSLATYAASALEEKSNS